MVRMDHDNVEVRVASNDDYAGPVDLDELFNEQVLSDHPDDASLFGDDDDETYEQEQYSTHQNKYFNNPHKRLLDQEASLIPGSPFSKPSMQRSNRPAEPLSIAKYASSISLLITLSWVIGLILVVVWEYKSAGRIVVEVVLALLSFLGLFWNSYFCTSMFFKCFIPARAFQTNTKYCSIIPETKPDKSGWIDVTIQIPVYKESLHEVLMPTLKSCQTSRDYYQKVAGVRCNIVVCDDGMMNMLKDNFPAAEMLWEGIQNTRGRVLRLSRLLKDVPRAARRHLKGLRSKDVYEVFHRMLYYYHYEIGFVARSTIDRRGKFKKASNLNSHLRLYLGAQQLQNQEADMTIQDALLEESHNADGSRFVMFGNDIALGDLICINDADARMAETVIYKTVPEFLNDPSLGFTQHATKTMTEQRGESYYTNLLAVYTDALYQGHFLLSSIMGCHPPLVGHSIFLRTDAVAQCGRMRTLRKAQGWLKNIGLPFLPVDQIGFGNLQAQNRTEYWSENHVSEDFELMIHLYNLGFNGRYCAYPDCEFQEGITRTFDEEAGRHRKFSLGAHELVFNPIQDWIGHGIFTPLFRTFLTCSIPSYYKVFLTAYLCSYTAGGIYLIVFAASAVVRILDQEDEVSSLYAFSPAGVIVLNFLIYYIIGCGTFLMSLLRMYYINKKLLFSEYRKKCCGAGYIIFTTLRYYLPFQFLFFNVIAFTYFFLGSMDHLMARPGIVGTTNKDSITMGRCTALWETIKFNSGSWVLALMMAMLAYLTMLQEYDWDFTKLPDNRDEMLQHAVFAGPPIVLAIMAIIVPIILNPYILGWPFVCRKKKKPVPSQGSRRRIKKDALGREIVDIPTFMNAAKELNHEIERAQNKPDVELGSLATRDFTATVSPNSGSRKVLSPRGADRKYGLDTIGRQVPSSNDRMYAIPEGHNRRSNSRGPRSSSNGRRSNSRSKRSSAHRGEV